MKYEMKCTCGDVISVEAETREEAVKQIKDQMTAEAIKAHFAEKHKGQFSPPVVMAHMLIDQAVKPVESE